MAIMETAIEGQLKTTYGISDEELDAFYDSFKHDGKIKAYEAENKDVVDILFSFIDFDKFKQ